MDWMQHTLKWYHGEVFEAAVFGAFGLCLMLVSLCFWKFGKTGHAQAVVIPLLVVGLILIAAGGWGIHSNQQKAKHLSAQPPEDMPAFVQSEQQRVQAFMPLYTYTKIGAALFFAFAMVVFFVTENRHWQAAAMALIVLGLTGLVIDYFSKERALTYQAAIEAYAP